MARIRGPVFLLGLVTGGALAAQQPAGTPTYQREVPAALRAEARIGEDSARTLALLKVAGGRLESVELVREHGKLVYSFDIRNAKGTIDEVQVSAITGKVVRVEHENKKQEAAEKRKDRMRGSCLRDSRPPAPAG